jgi:hypothetical protein
MSSGGSWLAAPGGSDPTVYGGLASLREGKSVETGLDAAQQRLLLMFFLVTYFLQFFGVN